MKNKTLIVLFFLSVLFLINGASAAQISSDNFECAGFNCGSGWLGSWSYSGDCVVTDIGMPRGSYHMRGQEDASGTCIADRSFDNSLYSTNIIFWAKADVLESGDYCRYYYFNGSGYNLLLEISSVGSDNIYREYSYNVSSYGSSSNAGIRMRQFGVGSDNCYIDDINITGTVIDTTPPIISIIYPSNTSYNINVLTLNYSVSDNIAASKCWYSNNSGVWNSTSVSAGTNFTNVISKEGSNTWTVYCNDTNGNLNSSSVTFFEDTIVPKISYGTRTGEDYFNVSRNWIYVNVSVDETNFNNITFKLYSSTDLINSTTYLSLVKIINWTNLADGNYYYNVTVFDIAGNKNSTETRTIKLDNTPPSINIILPEEKTYDYNTSLALNYSVYDVSGVSSCWYNLDNEINITLVNCQNTTFNASDGSHIIYLYSNDSLGNLEFSTRSFSVSTTLAVSLVKPENNKWISYNNIEFNYTINTAADVLNCSLWGNFDGEWKLNMTNSSLVNASGGINKFSLNLTDGNYLWNIECYAGAYHEFGFMNHTINIDSQISILNVEYPVNNSIFRQNVSIDLNFTVVDTNLQSCWYSLNDGIGNRTINNCINGTNGLIFGHANGTYNLSIYANDSAGNLILFKVYNLTIEYDSIAPSLSLSEPNGAKTSQTGIPLQFFTNDSVDTPNQLVCLYNVYRGASLEVANTTLDCSSTTSEFSVSGDSSFIFNFYVKDRTGNTNIASSNFTVSTSTPVTPPGPGGGGGSGSGGGSSISGGNVSKGKLSLSGVGDIVAKAGDKKTLSLNAKNIGKIFLNNCKLRVSGEISSWIYSTEVSGIAPGENKNFVFDLNVPEGIEEKDYSGKISIDCDEIDINQDMKISIPKDLQSIKIKEIKQDKNSLNVIYTYEGGAGKVDIEIWILNKDNVEYKRVKDSFSADNNVIERNAIIDIPGDLTGIYSINLALSSDLNNPVKQSVVLGKSSTTGFAVLDEPGNKLIAYIVFVLIILVGILFIVFWNKKPKGIKTKIKVRE